MSNKPYSRELIAAVALWQNGWREDPDNKATLATELSHQASSLPSAAKEVPNNCYRVLLLDKATISTLFFDVARSNFFEMFGYVS